MRANVFRYALKLGHRLMQSARLAKQDVDGRVKPGHDSIGVRYGVNLYDTPARTVSMVWRPGLSALETTPGNVDTVDLVGSTPPKS